MRTDLPALIQSAPMPTADAEDWRYSRIGQLDLTSFQASESAAPSEVPAEVQRIIDAADDADTVLWTVDGRPGTPTDATVEVDAGDDALTAVHAALAEPLVVRPSGDTTVLVVHHLASAGVIAAPHLVVEAAANTHVQVVEVFVSAVSGAAVTLPVTELTVSADATLTHGTLNLLDNEVWQLGEVRATVAANATLRSGAAALGGDTARIRFETHLAGRGASTTLAGASFGSDDQLLDFRAHEHHDAPDTTSDLLFVGAVGNKSGSVYTGLIRIAPDAKRSNAFQTNRNLKLSDDCWSESVPNLEILNNEVHCSHASVFSPVDPEHRFYLESRGVPADRAERLLVRGFFDDIVERIPSAGLDDLLHDHIDRKLDRTLD